MLSRSGLELKNLWDQQTQLVEADQNFRDLERKANASEAPEDVEAHHHAFIRAGRSGDVMAHHVREHARAMRDYEASRDSRDQPSDDSARRLREAHWAIRRHHQDHGDHPADHAHREKSETPRQFGDRLRAFTLTNSTVYPPSSSEHDHGTISYAHDKVDPFGHAPNAKAMARAWEREVPGGRALQHNKTDSDGDIRGSVVSFRTDPPRGQRQHRQSS